MKDHIVGRLTSAHPGFLCLEVGGYFYYYFSVCTWYLGVYLIFLVCAFHVFFICVYVLLSREDMYDPGTRAHTLSTLNKKGN